MICKDNIKIDLKVIVVRMESGLNWRQMEMGSFNMEEIEG
jgi:hypothetical protein